MIISSCVSFCDASELTINGTSLKLDDGHYEAEVSVEIDRSSDAFLSAGKTEAQVKIIEDLLFSTIYNSELLKDIKSDAYKKMLSKMAVGKLLENKVIIKGLSEIEHRIVDSTLYLKMRVEKSKLEEIIIKNLN